MEERHTIERQLCRAERASSHGHDAVLKGLVVCWGRERERRPRKKRPCLNEAIERRGDENCGDNVPRHSWLEDFLLFVFMRRGTAERRSIPPEHFTRL